MLRAIINDIEVNPPDTLSFVFENPLLVEDRVPVPASHEAEFKPTPPNLSAFNHPERPTSRTTRKEFPATLYWEALPFFQGVANYNGFSENVKAHFKSVEKGNLKLLMSELPLETVNVRSGTRYSSQYNRQDPDNPINAWEYNYDTILHEAAFGMHSWVWAPLKTTYGETPLENYIGYANRTPNASSSTPYMAWGIRNPPHSITYPYPRISALVDAIFGGLLVSNPFYGDDFKDIVMPGTFHKDFPTILGNYNLYNFILDNKVYPRALAPVEMLYFNIASFMPDYASNEFVKDLMKIFGMVLYPRGKGFEIKTLDEIMLSTDSEDWSGKLIGDPDIDLEEGKTLEIEWTDIDEVEGTAEQVANRVNIFDATQYDEGGVAQVEVTSTGEVYAVSKMVESGTNKNLFSVEQKRAWFPKPVDESGREVFTIPISVKPLNCKVDLYEINNDLENHPTPHYIENFASIATSSNDRKSRKFTPAISRYIGIKPGIVGNYYPQLSSRAFDAQGNRVAPFSLEPYGPDGIINKFYSNYKVWLAKDKKRLDGTFLLTASDISTLDLSKKKHVDGVNYFIEKIEVELTNERIIPARVSLIEA